MTDDFQIDVVVDPLNDNWIEVLVMERLPDGKMSAEIYRIERTQRHSPGTIQVKLGKAGNAEQPLRQKVRQKMKDRYGG